MMMRWLLLSRRQNISTTTQCFHRRRFLLFLFASSSRHYLTATCGYSTSSPPPQKRVVVIGGGASGIFAAIHAANNNNHDIQVTVLEATRKTLQKVKISGGGRCNVLHDSSKAPHELLSGYPRGSKELRGILSHHFTAVQAAAWFTEQGVALKTEDDGRMFPVTDSSATVMKALLSAAEKAGVTIQTQAKVTEIHPPRNTTTTNTSQFEIVLDTPLAKQQVCRADAVIMATGSARVGYQLLRDQEQPFVDTVPSLFTLYTAQEVKQGGVLHGLAGISVEQARISFCDANDGTKKSKRRKKQSPLTQQGPLLITHQGFSGPAALRLSAFGARAMADSRYQGDLTVHWAPQEEDELMDTLWQCTRSSKLATTKITQFCPLPSTVIPKRLWVALVRHALGSSSSYDSLRWADLSKAKTRALAQTLQASTFRLTGKGTFKEEFVTAGGVSLAGIDMKTMQSKTTPGLFFCGELINVDGITGGYNFMNCWGTGFVAGTAAAEYAKAVLTTTS